MAATWQDLVGMNTARYDHACQMGQLDGQSGVFVSGGADRFGPGGISSVEFFVAELNHWQNLGDMKAPRSLHSLSLSNGIFVAAGGTPTLQSVEVFNGTEWVSSNDLITGRQAHAAVSVPAGIITC